MFMILHLQICNEKFKDILNTYNVLYNMCACFSKWLKNNKSANTQFFHVPPNYNYTSNIILKILHGAYFCIEDAIIDSNPIHFLFKFRSKITPSTSCLSYTALALSMGKQREVAWTEPHNIISASHQEGEGV